MEAKNLLDAQESESDEDSCYEDGFDAPPSAKTVCSTLGALFVVATVVGFMLIYIGSGTLGLAFAKDMLLNVTTPPSPEMIPGEIAFAGVIGIEQQDRLRASILALISLGAVVGSTLTASIVVTFTPEFVPSDFRKKGTLSNVCQDISTPQGRIFSASLYTAGILQLFSMYTFWLYRCWHPRLNLNDNPYLRTMFAYRDERIVRTLWLTLPHVGFMFTAAIPSMSRVEGYQVALTAVHNVCAPLSMAFCVIMETVQLSFGEKAFEYFFFPTRPEGTIYYYGWITNFQRLRVILAIYAWIAAFVFLSVQVYFGAADVFGMRRKLSYKLALISFYGEVIGMVVAFLLPAVSAWECLSWDALEGPVIDQARRGISEMQETVAGRQALLAGLHEV